MPKTVAEIKNFNKGIMATPDAKDIPTNAADYSLNVETIASDGQIKGRKGENYVTALGGFSASSPSGIGDISVSVYNAPSGGGGGGA